MKYKYVPLEVELSRMLGVHIQLSPQIVLEVGTYKTSLIRGHNWRVKKTIYCQQ